jgi:esterase/lipase
LSRAIKIAALLGVLGVAAWLLTPAPVTPLAAINADFAMGPDAWLQASNDTEHAAFGIVPGTEARIVWQAPRERTEYAVVYVHGFSASRQEIAPVPERVAEALGANLYEARLGGHGRETGHMEGVSAEGWIDDVSSALRIGALLGEKTIFISTSTGSTLGLALLDDASMEAVETLVMVSPNIAPSDPKAQWLVRPGGPLLGHIVTGGTRSWEPYNELQDRYWTTSYPINASIEVMRLVKYANQKWPRTIAQNLLMFVSPHDTVVQPEAAHAAFDGLDAPRKKLVEIRERGEASNHVVVGDVLWPENNDRFVREIVDFVRPARSLPALSSAPE